MKKSVGIAIFVIVIFVGVFVFITQRNELFLSPSKTFDLGNSFTQGNVIDKGTYQGNLASQSFVMDFEKIYQDYKNRGEKVYFIFGNEDEVKISTYNEIVYGRIDIFSDEKTQGIVIKEDKYTAQKITPQENYVKVTIAEKDYEFNLKTGENFYFLVSEPLT